MHIKNDSLYLANILSIGAKCGYLGGSPPQVWSLWRAVVLGNGAVEEAVVLVWQDLKLC